MDDLPEDPQTLYQAWKGDWPLRQWLYIGITNSPSRRFGVYRRRSEWMLETGTIRLTRIRFASRSGRPKIPDPGEATVLQRAAQPARVEVELSPENVAALGAAICPAILSLRRLADASSEWWVKRQAERQGLAVELPRRRNPFQCRQ